MLKKKYFKTKDEYEVTFEFETDDAQDVALVIDAHDWQPVDMEKRKKDGVYVARVRLPKDGQYQFRYLVNGQSWYNDPAADTYVANEYGSENSVVMTIS